LKTHNKGFYGICKEAYHEINLLEKTQDTNHPPTSRKGEAAREPKCAIGGKSMLREGKHEE